MKKEKEIILMVPDVQEWYNTGDIKFRIPGVTYCGLASLKL